MPAITMIHQAPHTTQCSVTPLLRTNSPNQKMVIVEEEVEEEEEEVAKGVVREVEEVVEVAKVDHQVVKVTTLPQTRAVTQTNHQLCNLVLEHQPLMIISSQD